MTEFIQVIEIKNGPVDEDLTRFVERLCELKEGEYAVTVSTLASHSRKQQNTFYMLCRKLGNDIGYTLEEMIARIFFRLGYASIIEIDGEKYKVRWSESRLSKKEEQAAIDDVYLLAHELDKPLEPIDSRLASRS